MEESFKRRLEENGVDVGVTLRRFLGNEDMYAKFLQRFLEDPSYRNLGEQLRAGSFEEAFRSAHTLKGVAANLGLTPLQNASSELVEELRGKKREEVDVAKTDAQWRNLTEVYDRFVDLLRS